MPPLPSTYLLLTAPFGIRCNVAPARDALRRLLEPLELETSRPVPPGRVYTLTGERAPFELLRGPDRIRTASRWGRLVEVLIEEMNRWALADFDGFACHAGVVATRGRAIAFPAVAEAGKSTLTAACILDGFDYVSDEALCLDLATGALVTYPKPMALSAWSRSHLRIQADDESSFVALSELGAAVARPPGELTDIAFLARREGPPSLTELPGAQIVAGLVANSFNHYKHPAESFKLATELARSCHGWKLEYDSAVDAASLLRARFAG